MKKPTYSKKKNKKGCATLISTTSDNKELYPLDIISSFYLKFTYYPMY